VGFLAHAALHLILARKIVKWPTELFAANQKNRLTVAFNLIQLSAMKDMKTNTVDCYYNLHKHCLSVRHKGLVVNHAQEIALENVKFVVSQAGRRRVLEEKRKNVHAFVRGEIREMSFADRNAWGHVIKYNPYKYSSFVTKNEIPVKGAKMVAIFGKKIVAWGLEF
jgi:hypothetical protein